MQYKNGDDIPSQLRRRLFRLSALFELADQELSDISNSVYKLSEDYTRQISSMNHDNDIELNLNSLNVFFKKSPVIKYWTNFIHNAGFQIIKDKRIPAYIGFIHKANIFTINKLHLLLENSQGKEESYVLYFLQQIKENQDYIVESVVILLFLVLNFPDVYTKEVLSNYHIKNGKYMVYAAEQRKLE